MNHLSPLIDPRERQLVARRRGWGMITLFVLAPLSWLAVYLMWQAL